MTLRADRVGTPHFHSEQFNQSSTATAMTTVALVAPLQPSIINPVPLGLYDRYGIRWNGAVKSIAATGKSGLMAQVTVPKPIAGNVVNLEIVAQLLLFSTPMIVTPFFCKLTAAVGAQLAVATSTGAETPLLETDDFATPQNPGAAQMGQYGFRRNVLLRDVTKGTPEGTYAFGFMLTNPSAAALTFGDFTMTAAVRQKMDQPGIAYEDTRR